MDELIERYVAVWNEPDAGRRADAVRGLWTERALHRFQPPEEARDRAAALGAEAIFEVRGHAALEDRVARAHAEFVAPGAYRFRRGSPGARLGDMVTFRWEMAAADGTVAGGGLEVLQLAPDGRIAADHQFID